MTPGVASLVSRVGDAFERRALLLLSLFNLAFLTISTRYVGFTLDDSYIALRYSRHLADGHGSSGTWEPIPSKGSPRFSGW